MRDADQIIWSHGGPASQAVQHDRRVLLQVEGQSEDDLIFLLKHDTDAFSRWDAAQRLQQTLLLHLYSAAIDTSKVGNVLIPFLSCCVRIVPSVPGL